MKKQLTKPLLMLLILCMIAMYCHAQSITNYTFSSTSGSFTPIVGGTPVSTSLSAADFLDDTRTSIAIPIGFDFVYMGNIYTQVIATSDGFLSFNTSALSQFTNNLTSSVASSRPLLAPLWDDLDGASGSGAANYITEGAAGSRIFTIEWLNWQWNYSATGTTISFQIKLYEATGTIEFAYRDDGGTVNSGGASIGITAINTGSGNFLSLDGTGATPNVSSTSETTNLSTKPATGQIYTFTPPLAPNAPSNFTFSNIKGTSMTLNWTDNATNETGYLIYKSLNGTDYTLVTTAAANATNYVASGLAFGTMYYWRIIAVNEGKASSPLDNNQSTVAGAISGNKLIGPTGDYASLTAAFADIDTNGLANNTNLILQTTYNCAVETFPIAPSTVATEAKTISVYPETGATNLTITSNNATGTINFNGSNYITFDGRPNASGVNKELVIENTSTTGFAIRLINDACYNTIRYCDITGVTASTSNGVINFANTSGITGNDNNTIEFCNIHAGATTPYNIIYSYGTAGKDNSNNTIAHNNIYDFFYDGGTSSGLYLNYSSLWTIDNNSFYQTANRSSNSAASLQYPINIFSGSGYVITNNFIGGTAPNSGGTPWTLEHGGTARANRFVGMYVSAGALSPTIIQKNTITNFVLKTSSGATTNNGIWCGIYISQGEVNVGGDSLAEGNIIGSMSTNGAISVTSTTNAGLIVGISSNSANLISIKYNQIGGISTGGTASVGYTIYGIGMGTTSTIMTVTNNIIGSSSIPNSIQSGTLGTTTANCSLRGISNLSSGSGTIANNTITNLTSNSTHTSSTIFGIFSNAGKPSISGNIISELNVIAANIGTGSSASINGISMTSSSTTGQSISGNTIFNLRNTNTSAATCINGIFYNGPTGSNIIEKNKIYNLILSTSATSHATPATVGIYTVGGTSNFQNNMITLGNGISSGYSMAGIYETAGTNNFYHNSVYIGGSDVVSANLANTYALYSSVTINTRNYINNIFVNERSNLSGTGKHYIIRLGGSTPLPSGLTCNYNDYYSSGTGSYFGYYNLTDVADFATWKTAVGHDNNSINENPQYLAPTAATPDLHINPAVPTYAEGNGVLIASVTDDFDGQTRADFTPIDIGADAGNFTAISTSTFDVSTIGMVSPNSSICPASNQTITVTIKNLSSETLDFATKNVTVGANISGASTQNFATVINTGTLAVNDTLNVNVTTSCNLTTAGTHNFSCYALITGDVNTANDTLSNKAVVVNALPVAVTAVSANYDTICVGFISPIVLTAIGGSGDILEWYSASCGGTYIGSGNNLEIAAPDVNTKYFALWSNICGSSDCDSLTVTVLENPTATATPVGPTILPVNSDNTDYTTSGATYATAYEWLVSPVGAGVITGTGTTGTVDWNDAYEGQAEISVVAWNANCPGDTSDVLTVTLTAPVITTLAASNITSTGATLNGSINPNGLIIRDIVFQYGLSTSYTNSISATVDTAAGTSLIYFSADVTGLTSATTYHFRIYGEANTTVFTGADETFTTNAYMPQFDVTFNVTDGTNPINGAVVSLAGYGTQTTNGSGVAVFNNVDSNDVTGYDYTVIATSYNTVTGNIGVGSDTVVDVLMTLTPLTYTVTFNVTDGTNPINGALVELTGYGTQTTTASGIVTFTNVDTNTVTGYEWTVTAAGYEPETGNIAVDGNETVNVYMSLTPVGYTVTFNVTDGTNPINAASVNLTGYGIQTTNASGVATFTNVAAAPSPGIAWEVTKTGYNNENGNVIVDGNETVNVTMDLTTYTVTFNVTDGTNPVNAATVTLTGYGAQTTNSSGIALFTNVVPAGAIAYTVEKTGYTTQTGNANVTGNQTVNVVLPLATYTVTFNVTDGTNPVNAANVTLSGYGSQTTNASGVATFSSVAATPAPGIAYSVTKTGFNTSTGNVIVDGNETVNITLNHSYYDVIFHVYDNVTNAPWNNIPVAVLGESVVNTNISGIASFSLIMGNYNYEVRFTNDTIEGNFTVPVADTIKVPYHVSIVELGNVSFGVYPNPAKEIISITSNETIETVKLIDITGTVIATFKVNSRNTNLDIANLPEGNYIVLVETAKGKGMRKLQLIK